MEVRLGSQNAHLKGNLDNAHGSKHTYAMRRGLVLRYTMKMIGSRETPAGGEYIQTEKGWRLTAVIVGAGKTGFQIAKMLAEARHNVE